MIITFLSAYGTVQFSPFNKMEDGIKVQRL